MSNTQNQQQGQGQYKEQQGGANKPQADKKQDQSNKTGGSMKSDSNKNC